VKKWEVDSGTSCCQNALKSPGLKDIWEAETRIRPYAHKTPVLTCQALNERLGANLFLKCENFQKVGAFKFRGACNAVFSLSDEEAAGGVVAHSSGNHAQALALAAKLRGIPAYIVMPSNAPDVKKEAVRGYGAHITFCEPTLEARESTQAKIIERTGAYEVHPYNNFKVMAGAGTATLELLSDVPTLDIVMAPVGGGGLLSGTAICATEMKPGVRVVAAEPKNADDAFRSLAAGRIIPSENPQTIADGLLTSLGSLTFPVIQQRVEKILTANEEEMVAAMRFVWERTKIVIEPSSAVAIAALWNIPADMRGKNIGVIISGGNVDLTRLPWQVL
jgi:threonine dehydratase